jgi:hypothetical protein
VIYLHLVIPGHREAVEPEFIHRSAGIMDSGLPCYARVAE